MAGGTQAAGNLCQALAKMEVEIIPAEAGQSLDLGEGARLRVLAVSRRGAVLLLEWIARLRRQVVLLIVRAGDRRNLPNVESLEAIQGYSLLHIDRNSWIDLSTDGEKKVEVAR